MKKVAKHWVHFEALEQAPHLRTIQILPKVPPGDLTPDFEEYMREVRHCDLSRKFSFVLLAMLHFYPDCAVYVDSERKKFYRGHKGLRRDKDVHDASPKKLESYIHAVAGTGQAMMAFHFTKLDILVRLLSGLDNEIFGHDPEFDALLSKLVASQGLFLETYENVWWTGHIED